jgi:hypothetical protein
MSSKNGMFLKKGQPTNIKEALWWEEQCVRRQGGYDLDTTNLPAGTRFIPKGTLLELIAGTGKVKVVKSATVYANAAQNATTLQIVENPLIKVGDTLAGSQISAISTEDGVSTLTVAALASAVSKDAVVTTATSESVIVGLQYETIDLQDVDFPQVAVTLQAFEIEEATMPQPINATMKQWLGPLHQFKIQ